MAVSPPYANFNLQETQEDSLLAGATIRQYERVVYTASGTIIPAPNTGTPAIGTARTNIANGEVGPVRLDLPQQFGRSNTLINVGDVVYEGATGFVTAVAANNAILGVAKIGTPAPAANTSNNQAACVWFGVRKSAI
jgi:hypothetical protein